MKLRSNIKKKFNIFKPVRKLDYKNLPLFTNGKFIDGKIALIYICVIILGIVGCIFVYSASCYSAEIKYNNRYNFLIKQIIGVVLGTAAMIFFSFVNYQRLKKFKFWAVIVAVVLLLIVFIPGVGVENYGAKRWINLGLFTIQPSEFAKFALVLFAAAYLSDNYEKVNNFKTVLPVIFVGGIFCLLVILEPNMSITMCIGLIMLFMLFVGGMRLKHFAICAVPAAAAVPALILIEPYRIQRFMAFLNPWASPQGEGFQLIQSLYGLGNGSWFGAGLFQSRQKFLFLPFAESDFIFSIIGEEIGFVGGLCILGIFAILIYLLISIGKNAGNRFGCLLALGIAAVIAIQTILNVCVVTGTIPPTGLPLPFISAGSTSIIVFMAAVGVAVNVHKQSRNAIF